MSIDAAGVALVIAAIGGAGGLVTAIGNFALSMRAERAKEAKDRRDDAERREARRAQLHALQTISDKSDAVHTLVNDRSTQQDIKIEALTTKLAKGGPIPEMLASEAAPGQVTQDTGVISVGKSVPYNSQ